MLIVDMLRSAYRVVELRSADGAETAPPEVRERFEGRLFSLHELEQRGVRIAGAHAWYAANGRGWRLELEPAV
jgi:hypothetical protein